MKLVSTIMTAVALAAASSVSAQSSDAPAPVRPDHETPATPPDDANTAAAPSESSTSARTEPLRGDSTERRMTRDEAREMQRLLKAQGYYQETVDGIVGPRTIEALRTFQRAQRLPVTGRLDRDTALSLGMPPESVVRVSGTREPERASPDESSGERRSHGSLQRPDQGMVRAVQSKLETMGFNPGPIDGILGPLTRESIKAFQRANDLAITGRVDAPTLAALGLVASDQSPSE